MLHQGGHQGEEEAAGISQARGWEGKGHFSRRQERSSISVLAGTEGDRSLPIPSGLHPVRVYPL